MRHHMFVVDSPGKVVVLATVEVVNYHIQHSIILMSCLTITVFFLPAHMRKK